jgi:hypothetical protein
MQRSTEAAQLFSALAAAQGEIESATKDQLNPHFGKSYADLASVREVSRLPLSKNGLCIIQSPAVDGVNVVIETLLAHKSGEWVSNDLRMLSQGNTPQAIGSAITYGRRYAMMSILGIAPAEDDDGNAASGRAQIPPPASTSGVRPPPKPAPVAAKNPSLSAPGKATPPAAPAGAQGGTSSGGPTVQTTAAPTPATTLPPQITTSAPAASPAPGEVSDDGLLDFARAIRDAKTLAELDGLVTRFKGMTEPQRAELRPLYLARLNELNAK